MELLEKFQTSHSEAWNLLIWLEVLDNLNKNYVIQDRIEEYRADCELDDCKINSCITIYICNDQLDRWLTNLKLLTLFSSHTILL